MPERNPGLPHPSLTYEPTGVSPVVLLAVGTPAFTNHVPPARCTPVFSPHQRHAFAMAATVTLRVSSVSGVPEQSVAGYQKRYRYEMLYDSTSPPHGHPSPLVPGHDIHGHVLGAPGSTELPSHFTISVAVDFSHPTKSFLLF